jgi:hypothetical protein
MKTRIKIWFLPLFLLTLLCVGSESKTTSAKLRPPPADIPYSQWVILPRNEVYEVGASKMHYSLIRNLPESGFMEVSIPSATGLTGRYYQCPSGKRPYLVWAVYPVEGFGEFRVERHGDSLLVIYGPVMSFQPTMDYQQSTIIVNLDFTPDEVYNDISGLL